MADTEMKGASFQEQAKNLEKAQGGLPVNPELEKDLPHQKVQQAPQYPGVKGAKTSNSAGVADPARGMALAEHAQMEQKHGKAEPIQTLQAASPESDPIKAALDLPQQKRMVYSAGTGTATNDTQRVALQEFSTSHKKYSPGEIVPSAEYQGMNLVEKSKVGFPKGRDQNNPTVQAKRADQASAQGTKGLPGGDPNRLERHVSK